VLVLECGPEATWSATTRHRIRRLARETSTMLWWNDDQCRLVFVVRPDGNVPASERARGITRDVERMLGGDGVINATRIVAFRGLPSVESATVAAAGIETSGERAATPRLAAPARQR
jgi:hypothetical protein